MNPADLMSKPLQKPKIEQHKRVVGTGFVEQYKGASRVTAFNTGVSSASCRMKF